MSIDAMKQALEALQHCLHYAQTHLQHFDAAYNRHPSAENERGVITDDIEDAFAAIGALRAAIEQAKAPVAWMYEHDGMVHNAGNPPTFAVNRWNTPVVEPYTETPLYTSPRQWQGLTDEDLHKLRHLHDPTAEWTIYNFARAIEAKLKEKNA